MEIEKVFKDIILSGEKQNRNELINLIKTTPQKLLIETIKSKIQSPKIVSFWSYVLRGFSLLVHDEVSDKRFHCVKALLCQINETELNFKITLDLMTRLCSDLPTFAIQQLIEIVEYCQDSIKMGDPKCVGWKELLPETLWLLTNQDEIVVESEPMTGVEYRARIIKKLCNIQWPVKTLTPIASLFVELKLNNDEIPPVLIKFSKNILKLSPDELPPLAFQLFSLSKTASQLILPIMAFKDYFHRYHYKQMLSDMDSNMTDFDCIDTHSAKELREAEETILFHLSYCTRFTITEQQMCNVLKNLSSSSEVILNPFFVSAILSMSEPNRKPDLWSISSNILLFLKTVIKNNETEKELLRNSIWCRDNFPSNQKDLEQIFTVLIEQNKDGKDVITPGIVKLGFVLLRAKNSPELNEIASNFLQQFIKKRFLFGKEIIQKLTDWMLVEPEENQYIECLTKLAIVDTFTVSECLTTIKNVLEFLIWIPGNHAMRIISFILPVIKISSTVRDYFIEILRRAIKSRNLSTCRLGVYGFAMLLKQLNNNNSQRSGGSFSAIMTQQISGYSLMSQTTLSSRDNPQRHFDILTLELIGCFRICLTAHLDVRETLYESLNRAIELNQKLIPHLLDFIDYHFRSYFDFTEFVCHINFDKIITTTNDEQTILVHDNLGMLSTFVCFAIIGCEKNEFDYDVTGIKSVITSLIERINSKDLKLIEMTEPLDFQKISLTSQCLNLLEALMLFLIWTSKPTNDNIDKMFELFKEHNKIRIGLKNLCTSANKKTSKKSKNSDNTTTSCTNTTINGMVVKKFDPKCRNIWELPTIEKFLLLLFDDIITFGSASATEPLRSDRDLVRYVLQSTSEYFEYLRLQPAYKQIAYSLRIFKNLTDVTRIIYERCTKKLEMLWTKFDVTTAYLSIECLHQSLTTAKCIYKKKFITYLKGVDLIYTSKSTNKITIVLQNMMEKIMDDQDSFQNEVDTKKIPETILQCLDILYDFIPHNDQLTIDSYNWLMKFCQTYESNKECSLVHKILFNQRVKIHSGPFFSTIAAHLEDVIGAIKDDLKSKPKFPMKSITSESAESCLIYLMTSIRKQVDDVEFFVNKIKCMFFKLKITSDENNYEKYTITLKSTERAVNAQIVHLTRVILILTNIEIPLGTAMDNLIRLIIQLYNILTQLTKHLISRHSVIQVSCHSIGFDQVIRLAGIPLATRIYTLIAHFEPKILSDNTKKSKPLADRAKVIRDMKLLPKLIFHIENLNKFVTTLSRKIKGNLTDYLHMGTVRDFSVKTADLIAKIDQTASHSSQNEENLDNDENHPEDVDSDLIDTPEILNNESKSETASQFFRNAEKVSAKIRKRKSLKEKNDDDDATAESVSSVPAKRQTRQSKKK